MRSGTRVWSAITALAALLLATVPAGAAAVRDCDPEPVVPTSFCVSYDAGFTSVVAGAPMRTTISMVNDSEHVATDISTWLQSAEISLLASNGTSPRITPSTQLPAGLIVVGGGTCTSPSFSDCAGRGTIRADISGTGGLFDGIRAGTFGLSRITNINPPAPGFHADYRADLEFCLEGAPSCQTTRAVVRIPEAGGDGGAALTLTLPAFYEYEFDTGFGTANVDASIESLTLDITGRADMIQGGDGDSEADRTYRVFSMPVRCGAATSNGTFLAHDGVRSVSVTQPVVVSGCPTAALAATPDGFAVELDGGMSSTPVAGRSITQWLWDFGDGEKRTTTGPLVRHTYTSYGHHTVRLVVQDSAGVRSRSRGLIVRGTTITAAVSKTATRVRASGTVLPKHGGQDVTVALFRHSNGAFRHVTSRTVALDAASTYSTGFDRRPPGQCQFRVTFPGDAHHLGSKDTVAFAC